VIQYLLEYLWFAIANQLKNVRGTNYYEDVNLADGALITHSLLK
jgi:hypothetical protein